jgi:hypothetical protein
MVVPQCGGTNNHAWICFGDPRPFASEVSVAPANLDDITREDPVYSPKCEMLPLFHLITHDDVGTDSDMSVMQTDIRTVIVPTCVLRRGACLFF